MGTDKTTLGDRMKEFESPSTSRKAFIGQPIIVRLDGNAFHTFTKGLKRPYDERLSSLMVHTMDSLVERFNARLGYVQSDEISLMFYENDISKQYIFNGRFQKFESLIAAYASVVFNRMLHKVIPEKANETPIFDCRAFVVPTLEDAYLTFLWRQNDCTKNAVSMAAQSMFSHKELQGKHSNEMQEMMFSVHGVDFNDYPYFFKRGIFCRKENVSRFLNEYELSMIPEKYRPVGKVERSYIRNLDIWISKQPNPIDILFFGQEPV